MASSLQHSLLHHQNQSFPSTIDTTTATIPAAILLKPKKTSYFKLSSSLSTSFSSSSTTPPTPTTPAPSPSCTSLDLLTQLLTTRNYRLADDETRRLLIALAGEAAQKRGYVFFSEVQFIPASDLQAIDKLWVDNSDGRFGYSVQRRVWEKLGRDFTRFFIKLGWMKKLESEEVDQYGYRSFPGEFIWEMEGEDGVATPEGHLPLTNALRGTQLLGSVLTHPAFEAAWVEEEVEEVVVADKKAVTEKPREKGRLGGPGNLKPDYSF